MLRETEIEKRLQSIHGRMNAACLAAGRLTSDVRLLLATKTVLPEQIAIAAQLGEALIGENKVQELKSKWDALQHLSIERHFIGHLQSNKVKEVLKYVSCIQTVDSLNIADALQKRLEYEDRCIDMMVQLNTSSEESKFGLQPSEALKFVEQLSKYPRLNIVGLMTIGLFDADPDKVRPCFERLRKAKEEIIKYGLLNAATFRHLSMGMSNDLEIAIEEGATIIRVGTAIFGQRQYPDSYYWNENTPTA